MKEMFCTLKMSLCCIVLTVSGCIFADAQQLQIERDTTVASGYHPQYEMHVDPDDTERMMLCGYKIDVKDNAWYGYVYFSSDGGRTWHLALEPKNSIFESEESCAYGGHGIAYYVSSASKVIDDVPHHEQGTTHIYVSHDSGQTWALALNTGWNDWSTSAVDTAPGPNQNRLYAFFNTNEFYASLGQAEAGDALQMQNNKIGSWLGMMSYKDDDPRVGGPFFTTASANEKYTSGGSFPSPALLLKDGSILVFYTTKRRSENTSEVVIEAARAAPDRTGLEAPVKVVSSLDNPVGGLGISCGNYYFDSAAAYDAVQNKVYFIYPDVRDKRCRLVLTSSTDGGMSWSKAREVQASFADGKQEYFHPAMAINRDGVMSVMWQNGSRSGCWQFAISNDGGRSLLPGRSFGTCSTEEIKPSALTSSFLWTSFFQADSDNPDDGARIVLRNTHNNVVRNQDAVVADSEGKFHIVWSDAGSGGNGELRTATITVTPAKELIEKGTEGLVAETSKVAVLYGGNQFYDPTTKILTLDVRVRNDNSQPLKAPIKLAVPSRDKSQFADIANASNGVSNAGAIWDISSSVPGGTVAPGASTKPFALKFHYLADPSTPRLDDNILALSLKVFAAK